MVVSVSFALYASAADSLLYRSFKYCFTNTVGLIFSYSYVLKSLISVF